MIYLNIQAKYWPKKQGEMVQATRTDNGQIVYGECYFRTGPFFGAKVCEPHVERISHGYDVDPFSITPLLVH